jgi:hypothetical protein
MTDATDVPELVRLLAEQRGLARALKLYPGAVQAAAERGLRPLGEAPPGNSPIDSPAAVFDAARYEHDR